MSVLDRKLRRELFRAKGLLLAISSIIMVGILCFVAMRGLYHDLRSAQTQYYTQCRMADFWIDLKKAPISELTRLEEIPGVRQVRPRIQFAATVDLPDSNKPLNGLVLSLPEQRESVINDIVLRRGNYFTDRRESEVIVNDAFARARNLTVGDRIHLLMNERRQELLIVGTAISSEFTYLLGPGSIAPDPKHFGVFYVKHSFAEEVFDMDGAANQVVGLLTPESTRNDDALLRRLQRRLEPFGAVISTARKDQTSHLFLDSEITGLGVFATIMPAIFLAVAALVLNVLMTRLADQQRTVIGTLKALGYRDSQLAIHFLKFGLTVGLLGGLLGCVAGYFLAQGMVGLYQKFFEFPSLQAHFYPTTYLLGIAISLSCTLVGSLRGVRAVLRLRPAEAMRAKPPARGGRIWLERIGAIWSRLSFSWRMALRNVLRNRFRTMIGMFAAAVGASLLVIGFMSQEAMQFLIDFQYEQISRSDMDLTFEQERGSEALLEARALPGVDYAEPKLQVSCTFINGPHRRQGGITGLIPGARLTTPRDTQGNRLRIPESGLLMTAKMAELLHLTPGQTVTIRPDKGLRKPVQVPVMSISQSYLGTSVYADIDYLSHLVGEARAVNAMQLEIHSDPKVQDRLYRRLKELRTIQAVSLRSDVTRNLREAMIESQNASIIMLVGFAGVIFLGSIINSSLVSLAERQREIASLRVLGYGKWEIGGLFMRENLIVNLLGALIGLPLGWLEYLGMVQAYDMDLIRLPLVSPPWVWILTMALALVFALVAQLIVQWKIHRMDWLDALKVLE